MGQGQDCTAESSSSMSSSTLPRRLQQNGQQHGRSTFQVNILAEVLKQWHRGWETVALQQQDSVRLVLQLSAAAATAAGARSLGL